MKQWSSLGCSFDANVLISGMFSEPRHILDTELIMMLSTCDKQSHNSNSLPFPGSAIALIDDFRTSYLDLLCDTGNL